MAITKQPNLPVITIKKNDATTYTFNHFTSTYDFRLIRCEVTPPTDGVGGKFNLVIVSSDATNSNANTLLTNISEGNEVTVWIGKDNTTKTKVFLGLIREIEIEEPNKNLMRIKLSGPDWGSQTLKSRIVNRNWIQKLSGTTPDTSDNTTLVSQIVGDLLTSTQSYPQADFTVENQGLVYSSSNVLVPVIQLPSFSANYEKLEDKLTELDDISGTIHYVDADKTFHMRQSFISTSSAPATYLFTDDYDDSVASTWDQTKLGLIGTNSTYKRTIENTKRRIFGMGGEQSRQDLNANSTSGSTTLNSAHLAVKVTTTYSRLYKVGVYVAKVGSPTSDLVIDIREDNAGLPTGRVLRSLVIDRASIGTSTPTSANLVLINEDLQSNTIWLVLQRSGDASNTYRWYHDNTDNNPTPSASSADDITWTATSTPNRFKYSYIIYTSNPVLKVLSNSPSSSTKWMVEDTIRKADILDVETMTKLLAVETLTAFKKKETLHCQIYSPDTLLQSGQVVRIRKQQSGYLVDANFALGEITYIFESSDDMVTGSMWFEIQATRYTTFS